MNRRSALAVSTALGVALGCVVGAYDWARPAAAQPNAATDAQEILLELKGIRKELKEINAILHSNDMRVVPVVNPKTPQ